MINETTNSTTLTNRSTSVATLDNLDTSYTEENLWAASVTPWALTTPWTYDVPIFTNTTQLTNL
jgi:hypothetical protein